MTRELGLSHREKPRYLCQDNLVRRNKIQKTMEAFLNMQTRTHDLHYVTSLAFAGV